MILLRAIAISVPISAAVFILLFALWQWISKPVERDWAARIDTEHLRKRR